MDRRATKRIRRRLRCELRSAGRVHSGIVLNVSTNGLFVQTRAYLVPGTTVEVHLSQRIGEDPITLSARVARSFVAPPQLATLVKAGVGLRIESAPAGYRRLLRSFLSGDGRAASPSRSQAVRGAAARPAAARPAPSTVRYRIRACEVEGSDVRTLLVSCASEAEARELAQAELGPLWKVLEVRRH